MFLEIFRIQKVVEIYLYLNLVFSDFDCIILGLGLGFLNYKVIRKKNYVQLKQENFFFFFVIVNVVRRTIVSVYCCVIDEGDIYCLVTS